MQNEIPMPSQRVDAGNRTLILALQLVVACFLLMRLWFDLRADPIGDEAYYWMWGQQLELSYFDHPPLNAWMLWLIENLLGWNRFNLRLLTWFTLGGSFAIFWYWAKRISPANPGLYFWQTSAIYLAMPVMFLVTTIAINEHLLLFFALLSMHFFLIFADRWEEGHRDFRPLYLAALAAGFATLAKYNGVFLGLGFLAFIIVRPKMRPLLRSPYLYLAALLAIAAQAPVLYWNFTEGLASFRYHLTQRGLGHNRYLHFSNMVDMILTMAEVISPVLFLALFRLPWVKSVSPFEMRAKALGLTVFAAAFGAMLIVSLFVDVFFYWNALAYAALAIVAFQALNRRWILWLHLTLGLFIAGVFTFSFTVKPLPILQFGDRAATYTYGWADVAAAVNRQHDAHPEAFLAATYYANAAQLGFQLRSTDVTAFNAVASQYDYWFDASSHQGRDALIIADRVSKIGYAASLFRSVTKLEDVPVVVDGDTVWSYQIYLGEGFGEAKPPG